VVEMSKLLRNKLLEKWNIPVYGCSVIR